MSEDRAEAKLCMEIVRVSPDADTDLMLIRLVNETIAAAREQGRRAALLEAHAVCVCAECAANVEELSTK